MIENCAGKANYIRRDFFEGDKVDIFVLIKIYPKTKSHSFYKLLIQEEDR